ncbi:MAG: arylsulfatase [Candidatus Hydrogenedentes bacterium]|nr:arylsulfatase [Candidatus Hydrogenedentota bacterium]
MRYAFAFVMLMAALFSSGDLAAERPPNIVYILADDLGYAELGCYGQKHIKTPHIDRLAAEGMRFTQHYTAQAVCAPARSGLMTGLHMGHAPIRNNASNRERVKDPENWQWLGQVPIPDDTLTIAEVLQARGYATAAYGKWGLGYEGSSGDPLKQGFDDFGGFLCQEHAHNHYPRFLWKGGRQIAMPGNDRTLHGESYSQDYFVQWGKDFIRENRERPFFLYLPFAIPHLSIQAPDSSVAEYRGALPEAPYEHRDNYLEHPHPRAGYAAMITHMDRGIGELMALLRELGLDENTLVVFSSDNGPTFDRLGGSDSDYFESSGPFRGRKGSLLEGGIRVPFVARWPGKIAAGGASDHVSAMWDLFPTFAELAGAAYDVKVDGISMVPALLGTGDQPAHDYLYWEFVAYGGQQALREGDWKALRLDIRKNGKLETELYNLAEDPGETRNRAAEHPDIVARLEGLMREARTPSELFPFPELDAE